MRVIVGFALAHYGGGILCDKNQYNLNDWVNHERD